MKKSIKNIILSVSLVAITSCAALYTSTSKSDLTVQTKMSSTIWLDPVAPQYRTVLVQVRNTSDNSEFNGLSMYVKEAFTKKGYKIEEDPAKANYMIQVNVRQAVLTHRDTGPKDGGTTGALLGGIAGSGGHRDKAIGGALLGGMLGTMVDASVKDSYYSVVADIQLKERSKNKIALSQKHSIAQGSSGSMDYSTTDTTDWKSYTTKLAVVANQANLKVEEATVKIQKALANSLSGLF